MNIFLMDHEEERCEKFFEEADFIKVPDRENEDEYACYYWEDFPEAIEFHKNNPDYFIYTASESDGIWISEGMSYVNRFAYLFSKKKIDIPNDKPIMLYPPDDWMD